jgi:hypothetical protein
MAPSPDDLAIVRRINVFRGLDPRMIQQMFAPASTLPLREREVVCRQRQFAAEDRGSARTLCTARASD